MTLPTINNIEKIDDVLIDCKEFNKTAVDNNITTNTSETQKYSVTQDKENKFINKSSILLSCIIDKRSDYLKIWRK